MSQIRNFKNLHTNTETKALEVALKETGLDVNAETTTYVAMSCEHNAGQNHT